MFFWLKKFVSFWLMPLPLCVSLIAVGIVFLLATRRQRLGRTLLLTGTLLLMLFSNNFVSRWLVRPLEQVYPAIPELTTGTPLPRELAGCRYVVVLGGGNGNSPGLSATNRLSTSALSRIVEGVRLLRNLPEARLIVSGPGDGKHETHATVLSRAAESLGIERSRILFIDQARDTEDESQAVKRIVGTAPVALVTSAWHMPRSMALFRHTGSTPVPCPANFTAHTDDEFNWEQLLWDLPSLERSTWAVRERIGYLWIWLRGRA